ncbi:MAG TPA: hypothetical protein VNO69_10270 [Methyloceanibacter sp.]|nr:hypothetical protein [Methyloceanibacter sp.]
MLFRSKKPAFSIAIARDALESIFDECDKYDVDETGGRLLGTYRNDNGRYEIEVKGVLEPGPNAQRSPTYFLQDGEYQENQFRAIEASHPDIEHLGNWHTHHVNGHPTLSGGDRQTYFRTVNHDKHNTDFFYALLVVSKKRGGNPRYAVKHFIFRRGDKTIYEIPAKNVKLVDAAVIQPPQADTVTLRESAVRSPRSEPNLERAKDHEFFAEFYPGFKSLLAKNIGAPYWKGSLALVDGSSAEIVTLEDPDEGARPYSIGSSSKDPVIADILERYKNRKFQSARHAVIYLERDLNLALYLGKKG